MCKCFITGLCFLLPLAIFAGTIDHSISLSASDVKTEVINDYDYLRIAGFGHLSEPGHPALPVQYLSFIIPADAQFKRLEVVTEQGDYLPSIYEVLPAQKPVPTQATYDVEFTPPDEVVYALDELYPGTAVQYVHEGNLAGYRIISVLVTPLRYNPVAKKLYLTEHITFRIHYQSGAVMVKSVTEAQKELARERVRQLVVNHGQVDMFAPPTRIGEGIGSSEYVIITDPAFVDAFEPLRQWKMKKGVTAEIVTTSWIYANYPDGDDPQKIRDFITDAVDAGAMYILVGGQCDWENNEEYVPRRDVYCWDCGYPIWPDIDTIPCDMYYSDLDGTWDGNENGIYGEYDDGVDMYSNVYVGRAPVKNNTQVENFVTKVITYETAPSPDFIKKVLLPAASGFTVVNDSIASVTPDDWQKSKLYDDHGLLSSHNVRDSIDHGFHLSHMAGHGNQGGIYISGGNPYYSYNDPSTQVNDSTNAIVVLSDACLTAALDHGWYATDNDCLAELMVNTNKQCAIATMMSTRFGWSSGMASQVAYSDAIAVWFYKKLFATNAYHLGEVLAAAKDELVPLASSDLCYRYCLYEYILFGDPEMQVWTDLPDTMIVTHAPIVYTEEGTFTVTVSDAYGIPLQDALVCCWIRNQDPVMHATQHTDAFGTAVLNVSPTTHEDTMYVTVTKYNYLPHRGYAVVHEQGPYLTSSSLIVDDGGGNGQINPGEVIELGVWARNWGNQAALQVHGFLSETDPYTSVSMSESRYGRIAAHDSSLSRSYYRFSVAGNCPNKHVIAFDLEFEDRDHNTWISHPKVTVYAPVLTVEDVSVVNDNNGDGVLGPSETADLVVSLKNEGGATAENVTSLLTTSSPYITITDAVGAFGDIAPGAAADNAANVHTIILDGTTPYNTEIDFSIVVLAGAYCDTLDFTLTVYPPMLTLLGVNVVNDDNANGYLEPGETVGLVATLVNEGSATANKSLTILRTGSSYIAIDDSVSVFSPILSGDTVDNTGDPYTMMVSSETPCSTEVDFSIIVRSGTYSDTLDFTIMVHLPILTLLEVCVTNDDDGDGFLEPGETGDLVATIKNEGAVMADNTTSLLSTSSSHVTISDNSGDFGSIAPGETVDNADDPYTIAVGSETPLYSQVDLSVLVQAGLYTDTLDFTLNIGKFPPTDTGYYYAYYSGGPHAPSPVFEWIAIDSTQTEYPGVSLDTSGTWWYGGVVDLPFTFTYYGADRNRIGISAHGWIQFLLQSQNRVAYNPYNTSIPEGAPSGIVACLWDWMEVSNPDEPSDIYYYYDEPNHRFIVEFFRVEHYEGGDYETFEVILYDPAYYPTPTGDGSIVVQYLTAPQQEDITIGIRNFRAPPWAGGVAVGIQYYYDGTYHELAEPVTDSFAIKYSTCSPMSDGSEQGSQARTSPMNLVPARTLLNVLYPNPFSRRTNIAYQLAEVTHVHLRVYDAAGRLVRNLADGVYNPGYYTAHWDGCDGVGRKVPAGVYFVNFETDDYQKVNKTILLK